MQNTGNLRTQDPVSSQLSKCVLLPKMQRFRLFVGLAIILHSAVIAPVFIADRDNPCVPVSLPRITGTSEQ